jgi:hypothetical protein
MNTFQQAAAHADIHTPLLVIAGAGSGKVIYCALFHVVFQESHKMLPLSCCGYFIF